MLKQPTTQPTTKAEEPTTEEELINSADICFPGFGDLAGIDFL